ncbi:MAG: GTPase Era [Bacilli bacterium]|nr:GTPase Era [Bacilli bacterium]
MKSGFVSIVGRPNVGKSTLLNNIMKSKLAIISNKPQTTRNNIQGIYNDNEHQIVFIDTPGIHKPKHRLGKVLNDRAYSCMNEVDVILFLVDVCDGIGPGDKFIIERLNKMNKPVILVLNKIDTIKKEMILKIIDAYKDLGNFNEIVPISALKGENVDVLISVIKKYIVDPIKYYENDCISDVTKEFLISEYVREKILNLTDDEIPHSTTCMVENIKENKQLIEIDVLIIVEREGIKKIIIGKNGDKIKEIGTKARIDIEKLLQKKVFLKLYVKCIPKWRDKEKHLSKLGF